MNSISTPTPDQKTSIWKKLLCIGFSVLLILLLAMSVKQTATPKVVSEMPLSLADLAESADSTALDKSYDSEADRFTLTASSAEAAGSIALPRSAEKWNVLYVSTESNTQYQLSATYVRADRPDGRYLTTGDMLDDGRHLFLFYGIAEDSIRLELKSGSSVVITAINAVQIDGYTLGYAPNWIALGAFAVLVLLLILFEKKLGYFAWLLGSAKAIVATAKAVKNEHGIGKLVIHLLSRLAMAVFVGLIIADFAFNIHQLPFAMATVISASLAIAGLLADTCYVRKCARPAPLVFAMILILGAIFAMVIFPAMQVSWDDGYHFANSSYVPTLLTNGGKIPFDVHEYSSEHINGGIYQAYPNEAVGSLLHFAEHDTTAIDIGATLAMLKDLAWYYYPLALLAAPFLLIYFLFTYISYIPAIILLVVPGAVGADIIKFMLLGRLTNVFAYALLAYFAVRKLKSGKFLFSAFALLPIGIFLSANYSADWWINGAFMVGLAYFISILQNKHEKASKKDLIIMIAAFVLACGLKEIYFLMMLPLLLIPTDRFHSKKSARRTKLIIVALMLVILLSFLLPMLINTSSQTDIRGGSDVSASGQIAFILKNPLTYAEILINYIKDYIALPSMSSNLVMFGWLGFGQAFYSLIAVMVLFYCAFTDRSEHDRFRYVGGLSVVSILTAVAQIILVVTALYISYTPVGLETVNGCQYRYILPVFPLVLYFFAPISGENKMRTHTKCALVFGLMALAAIGAFYSVYLKPMLL